VIGIGDAICSQIVQFTYDTFVKDRHREIIASIHSYGARTKLHICGAVTHILPFLKEVGTDILDLDYDVGITFARSVMGEKMIHMGNISPMVVQNSTAEEVKRLSRELVAKCSNERFILSSGCEITFGILYENLIAMPKGCLSSLETHGCESLKILLSFTLLLSRFDTCMFKEFLLYEKGHWSGLAIADKGFVDFYNRSYFTSCT
jgi:Uroporphyrinogen decarboxylase (URO-D)